MCLSIFEVSAGKEYKQRAWDEAECNAECDKLNRLKKSHIQQLDSACYSWTGKNTFNALTHGGLLVQLVPELLEQVINIIIV